MRLLVHTCCAHCALKMQQSINQADSVVFSDICWYYYNPNIHPKTEYLARMRALKLVAGEHGMELAIANHRPQEYFAAINQLGSNPQPPDRCRLCWQLRLRASFNHAREHSFDAISTTLVTSHYQDQEDIEQIGSDLAQEFKLDFYLPANINKDLRASGFYQQNYCGCAYSLAERLEEKFLQQS